MILASGRSNNRLDTTRLEELCPAVPTIQTAMRDCLSRFSVEKL